MASKKREADSLAISQEVTTIDDLDLPHAVMHRLVKTAVQLPDAQLQKETKPRVFLNILLIPANDLARQANRKVISSADVLKALEIIEFDEFIPELREGFAEYQKTLKTKKANVKKKRTSTVSNNVVEHGDIESGVIASDELAENEEENIDVDELDGNMNDDIKVDED
ncbi:DNA polymerase epsilon noncatalytic subunit [Nowakowskiella sp. JEL0078]|nr:DNA polymerase epsilon noncatalytic subunit [Nowakowskiella sp. JEL0078]